MIDLDLEWGPARHRDAQDQPLTGADQRDSDRERPDDN